jgi:hypothetical protein
MPRGRLTLRKRFAHLETPVMSASVGTNCLIYIAILSFAICDACHTRDEALHCRQEGSGFDSR